MRTTNTYLVSGNLNLPQTHLAIIIRGPRRAEFSRVVASHHMRHGTRVPN